MRRGDFQRHHEVRGVASCAEHTLPERGFVERTVVYIFGAVVLRHLRYQLDARHAVEELAGSGVVHGHRGPIEAPALHEQTEDEGAHLWRGGHLLLVQACHLAPDGQDVDRNLQKIENK